MACTIHGTTIRKVDSIVFAARQQLRDSIVVSISACHAEDPGSILGRGICSLLCFPALFLGRAEFSMGPATIIAGWDGIIELGGKWRRSRCFAPCLGAAGRKACSPGSACPPRACARLLSARELEGVGASMNNHTHRGARTHDHKVKSLALRRLS